MWAAGEGRQTPITAACPGPLSVALRPGPAQPQRPRRKTETGWGRKKKRAVPWRVRKSTRRGLHQRPGGAGRAASRLQPPNSRAAARLLRARPRATRKEDVAAPRRAGPEGGGALHRLEALPGVGTALSQEEGSQCPANPLNCSVTAGSQWLRGLRGKFLEPACRL